MQDFNQLFQALNQSSFRRQFRLGGRELDYLHGKGLEMVLEHAAGFIERRLAPANPPNDGRQTPMRNHPVFIAQHATATCCRGCLQKWRDIPKGRELREDEKRYVLDVIERWLSGYRPQPTPAGLCYTWHGDKLSFYEADISTQRFKGSKVQRFAFKGFSLTLCPLEPLC